MSDKDKADEPLAVEDEEARPNAERKKEKETGGPKGPEPTRYGDWEKNGRCIDF